MRRIAICLVLVASLSGCVTSPGATPIIIYVTPTPAASEAPTPTSGNPATPAPTPEPTARPTPTAEPAPTAEPTPKPYAMVIAASKHWLAHHTVSSSDKREFARVTREVWADFDSEWEHLLAKDISFALNSALALCEWIRTDVPPEEADDRLFAVAESRTDDPSELGWFVGVVEVGSWMSFCPEYEDAIDGLRD